MPQRVKRRRSGLPTNRKKPRASGREAQRPTKASGAEQYRQARVAQDVAGGAAEDQFAQARVAVAADDEEVGVAVGGNGEQFLAGVAALGDGERVCLDAVRRQKAGRALKARVVSLAEREERRLAGGVEEGEARP